MRLYKYEATGNDFILTRTPPDNPVKTAIEVCDRHFGIGADGLLYPETSENGLPRMRYFNSDGSEAPMCGNGMRAFAKFLRDEHLVESDAFTVATAAGDIKVRFENNDRITIALGAARTTMGEDEVFGCPRNLEPVVFHHDDVTYHLHTLFLGTLHAVVFLKDKTADIGAAGHYLSTHPDFPRGINVNFVTVEDKNTLHVRTYERGAGKTLSCGTGVASSAYVAHRLGFCEDKLVVHVPGGTLSVDTAEPVRLSGPARKIAAIDYGGSQ